MAHKTKHGNRPEIAAEIEALDAEFAALEASIEQILADKAVRLAVKALQQTLKGYVNFARVYGAARSPKRPTIQKRRSARRTSRHDRNSKSNLVHACQ